MSPEKQRIAIAEACGMEPNFRVDGVLYDAKMEVVPDYLNDLNAMHEAEKVFEDDEIPWQQFRRWIGVLIEPSRHELHATAAQRAEAFLRTLGKWEES